MKTWKKILIGTGAAVAGVGAALTLATVVAGRRTHDAPTPAITASADPAVIARGRYLVYGAAHCVDCHGDPTRAADAVAGKDIPLSGGLEMKLPVGTFRPPNITPDDETGIGRLTDGQIARALRHGVRRDGRAMAPFMPFTDVVDEDLAAIISYLRSRPPVRNQVDTRSLNVLGHVVAAFVLKPQGPTGAVPGRLPPAPTAAYGKYLAHNVANCVGCHTNRDLRTGEFLGAPLSGGLALTEERHGEKFRFVTPNLTPDPATGRIAAWDEETFVARVRQGRGPQGSPMPWASFARMSDDDLRAIHRYLRTVPAVRNDTGDSVRAAPVASVTASR